MAAPQNIAGSLSAASQREVSYSWDQNAATSPLASFQSPSAGIPNRGAPKNLKPFNTKDIKILLLENVNVGGQEILKAQGYQVEALKTSLPEDQLIEKIRYVHKMPRHRSFFYKAMPLVPVLHLPHHRC
jgi:D-3-phosphoglycerate dehydrogenase